MNQLVNLESNGEVFFTAKYKLIWYKRDVEIFHENDKFKSYKIIKNISSTFSSFSFSYTGHKIFGFFRTLNESCFLFVQAKTESFPILLVPV